MLPFRDVAVIGLGYIGLPTAATLARAGINVLGIDVNGSVVQTINEGRVHIAEHDLDGLVREMVQLGRLRAANTPQPSEVFVIAVPTPVYADNTPDMSYVDAACETIAPVLKRGDLVIIESTSTVGTTERASRQFARLRSDLTFPHNHPETADILIAYCPERVLPGATLSELVRNARVIGGLDQRSGQRAREFYGIFVKGEILLAGAREAEMSKLTENAFRDVSIAFANELSMVCEHLGIDVWTVIRSANLHPRVNILTPGAGVGGHCIPIDPWFIIDAAPDIARLMRTARETNHAKTRHVVDKIVGAAADRNNPIALLGLSFKPDVDDLRESPSLEILDHLLDQGYSSLLVVEPNIAALPSAYADKPVFLVDLDAALKQAEIVAVLVKHRLFVDRADDIRKAALLIDPPGLLA